MDVNADATINDWLMKWWRIFIGSLDDHDHNSEESSLTLHVQNEQKHKSLKNDMSFDTASDKQVQYLHTTSLSSYIDSAE